MTKRRTEVMVRNPLLDTWEGTLEQAGRALAGAPALPEEIPLSSVNRPDPAKVPIELEGLRFRSKRAMRRVLEKKAKRLGLTVTLPDGSKAKLKVGKQK